MTIAYDLWDNNPCPMPDCAPQPRSKQSAPIPVTQKSADFHESEVSAIDEYPCEAGSGLNGMRGYQLDRRKKAGPKVHVNHPRKQRTVVRADGFVLASGLLKPVQWQRLVRKVQIGKTEKLLGLVMGTTLSIKEMKSYWTYSQLMEGSGIESRGTISKALIGLQCAGLLWWLLDRKYNRNQYFATLPSHLAEQLINGAKIEDLTATTSRRRSSTDELDGSTYELPEFDE